MSKPTRMVPLVSLWVCCYLLIHSALGSAEPVGRPKLELSGATFGGTFRRMLGGNPSTLDPTFVTDIYGGNVVRQIFDGLVQFDAHLNLIPAIAEFWEASQDGRTLDLYFAPRGHVSSWAGGDGTRCCLLLTRLLDPKRPGPLTELFQHIQGAEDFMQGKTQRVRGLKAVDRYTFQMVLEEPLAPLLAALGLPNAAIVPQEEVERLRDRFGWEPVGAGPFKFVRWEPNQEIVLEANDRYYEGRPFLDAVVFKIVVGRKLEERFAEFLKSNLEEAMIPGGRRTRSAPIRSIGSISDPQTDAQLPPHRV